MKTPFFTKLSGEQIKLLCTLAGIAQKAAKARFDPKAEVDADTWRKNGQDAATGLEGFSLRQANQSHFLPLRGHWFVIIGNLEQAFADFLAADAANVARTQMAWRLMGQVALLAEGIKAERARISITLDDAQAAAEAWRYTGALAKDKFGGRSIQAITWHELEQLGFTVVNRANAKLGKGDPGDRNKRQRRKSKPAQAAPESSLDPFERPSSPPRRETTPFPTQTRASA